MPEGAAIACAADVADVPPHDIISVPNGSNRKVRLVQPFIDRQPAASGEPRLAGHNAFADLPPDARDLRTLATEFRHGGHSVSPPTCSDYYHFRRAGPAVRMTWMLSICAGPWQKQHTRAWESINIAHRQPSVVPSFPAFKRTAITLLRKWLQADRAENANRFSNTPLKCLNICASSRSRNPHKPNRQIQRCSSEGVMRKIYEDMVHSNKCMCQNNG